MEQRLRSGVIWPTKRVQVEQRIAFSVDQDGGKSKSYRTSQPLHSTITPTHP